MCNWLNAEFSRNWEKKGSPSLTFETRVNGIISLKPIKKIVHQIMFRCTLRLYTSTNTHTHARSYFAAYQWNHLYFHLGQPMPNGKETKLDKYTSIRIPFTIKTFIIMYVWVWLSIISSLSLSTSLWYVKQSNRTLEFPVYQFHPTIFHAPCT